LDKFKFNNYGNVLSTAEKICLPCQALAGCHLCCVPTCILFNYKLNTHFCFINVSKLFTFVHIANQILTFRHLLYNNWSWAPIHAAVKSWIYLRNFQIQETEKDNITDHELNSYFITVLLAICMNVTQLWVIEFQLNLPLQVFRKLWTSYWSKKDNLNYFFAWRPKCFCRNISANIHWTKTMIKIIAFGRINNFFIRCVV
jgi:hypothetical protein